MTLFTIVQAPCVSSAILAKSAQIRSCQTPKTCLPETFCSQQLLPQASRWSVGRVNSNIPRSQRVRKLNGWTKNWDILLLMCHMHSSRTNCLMRHIHLEKGKKSIQQQSIKSSFRVSQLKQAIHIFEIKSWGFTDACIHDPESQLVWHHRSSNQTPVLPYPGQCLKRTTVSHTPEANVAHLPPSPKITLPTPSLYGGPSTPYPEWAVPPLIIIIIRLWPLSATSKNQDSAPFSFKSFNKTNLGSMAGSIPHSSSTILLAQACNIVVISPCDSSSTFLAPISHQLKPPGFFRFFIYHHT